MNFALSKQLENNLENSSYVQERIFDILVKKTPGQSGFNS